MAKYPVNPILLRMKETEKGSIYQSIVALGMRARQINDQIRSEYNLRARDYIGNVEESEDARQELEEISRDFDDLPKPTFIAMKELFEGKLHFEIPEDTENHSSESNKQ
ncbi:MAG TPA: DNA-directed RNA polymerase subunit omega [Candidatus Kapabacteria bacterium]|nr:DNA-directed RNA polymerase subunit omega [Candidatus Kapabacteria bacterium]HRT67917.1 DNA-directed RNA polymerase subunit omega [Bacteroidota bacterium]